MWCLEGEEGVGRRYGEARQEISPVGRVEEQENSPAGRVEEREGQREGRGRGEGSERHHLVLLCSPVV